jgi:hypothetical protein
MGADLPVGAGVEAARQERLAAQSSVEQRLLVAIQQADLLLTGC